MSTPQQNTEGYEEFDARKGSGKKILLVGCLSIIIAAMMLVGIGGVIVWKNWRPWVANIANVTLENGLDEFHLPQAEHDAMLARGKALIEEFRQKRISLEELKAIGDSMSDSDLMPMLVVKAMQGAYIAPSELSDEDKARGELAFGRLARGFVDDVLKDEDFKRVLQPISKNNTVNITVDDNGTSVDDRNFSLKNPSAVTTEELLRMIAAAEQLAEEKDLPPEPLDVDIVAEFDRIVKETLGRKLELPAPESETETSDPGGS
ncbi:MAG TPA: hypothetical protein ENJ00_10755 [Phycisphaerales bacterium]|nr:hypothetical protein [Phycisphaerales bacterium]